MKPGNKSGGMDSKNDSPVWRFDWERGWRAGLTVLLHASCGADTDPRGGRLASGLGRI